MITINNITKSYNGVTVLNIPALEIGKGESIGLVGNNGAGKTTLFNLILDLLQADRGEIKINGIQVNQSEEWKKLTCSFIDESYLIGYLTPEEYFFFIGELRGMSENAVAAFVGQFEDLFNGEVLNQKKYIRDFSKGNQKKIGIVSALMGNPELVILDEPFANLDPTTQIKLKEIIKQLAKRHETTILISSHDLSHTVETSTRIIALEKGIIVRDTPTSPETLKELENYFSSQIKRTELQNDIQDI